VRIQKNSYIGVVKKLAAILLTGMLLYNVVGYRAVFSWLEQHSYKSLNQQIDNKNYEEESLITIKLPIDQLPYYTNSPIFERTNGTVTVYGTTYQYVERRIYNDSLEMRCLANPLATTLTNARDLFFQLVNDVQEAPGKANSPAKPMLALKNVFSDYTQTDSITCFEPVFSTRSTSYNLYQLKDCMYSKAPQEQPPDAVVTV
jgi:hypothetical protein